MRQHFMNLLNRWLTWLNNGHVCAKGLLGYPCDASCSNR